MPILSDPKAGNWVDRGEPPVLANRQGACAIGTDNDIRRFEPGKRGFGGGGGLFGRGDAGVAPEAEAPGDCGEDQDGGERSPQH